MTNKARVRKRSRADEAEPQNATVDEPPRRRFTAGLVALGVAGLAGLGGLLRQRASASVTIHSEPVVYTQRGSASGTIHSEPAVDPQRTPASVTSPSEPAVYTYRVVRRFQHDPNAFTQGLLWSNGSLFESTGLYGESTLRELQLGSNGEVRVVRQLDLDRRDFGEGLVQKRGQLLQLLWRTGEGIRYYVQAGEHEQLRQAGRFRTPLNDGWGIEFDGENLVVTDSGHELIFLDPEDFRIKKRVSVTDNGKLIEMINELEMIGDELWGNIYGKDCLARIDKTSGSVTGWLVLNGILERQSAAAEAKAAGREGPDVLNGIAWDPDGKRIFVTGKLWPAMFEIQLEPAREITLERARRMCIPTRNIFRLR